MKLLDIAFDFQSVTLRHKEILLYYHSQLAMMEKSTYDGYLAIYNSSDQGPAIARIAFLVYVDCKLFMQFAKHVVKVATDLLQEVDSGKRYVGDKRQTIMTAASLSSYAKIMHDECLLIAVEPVFAMNPVLDYASTLFCFLQLYRCCMAPNEEHETYDEVYLNEWFNACDVPMIKSFKIDQVCLH